jgi:hypothetical protein
MRHTTQTFRMMVSSASNSLTYSYIEFAIWSRRKMDVNEVNDPNGNMKRYAIRNNLATDTNATAALRKTKSSQKLWNCDGKSWKKNIVNLARLSLKPVEFVLFSIFLFDLF